MRPGASWAQRAETPDRCVGDEDACQHHHCMERRRHHPRRQRLHRNCERLTQPIRMVLPDLLQVRLAKLTQHAAHVDMVIKLWVCAPTRPRERCGENALPDGFQFGPAADSPAID